ncbi:hypothetical protein NARC_30156 [Candidatus Nitrosocosmicus arcticus]|uniref:Uncharacterized protein n=1 Tax=Candidatus Nitrosocosmicus arcticus TaxID=2035267 RepID=A0A557SXX5_9ARCH|nr:hypothetical protein NARC_30156 [Candidatus Nitrosocosmicus arcticus]
MDRIVHKTGFRYALNEVEHLQLLGYPYLLSYSEKSIMNSDYHLI